MKSLVAIVAVIIVLAGGWFLYSTYQAPAGDTNVNITNNTDTTNNTNTSTSTGTSAGVGVDVGVDVGTAPMTATVTLGANGFTPKSVTIKKGGTVTFKNESTGQMWVASAQHPTHTTYSGTTLAQHCDDAVDTSFDQCESGTTYSFKFDKVGTWNYHNHTNSSQFGSVVVVE